MSAVRSLAAGLIATLSILAFAIRPACATADGAISAAGDTLRVDTLGTTPEPRAAPSERTPAAPVITTASLQAAMSRPTEVLPFAGNQVPIDYPEVTIGLGIGGFVSGITGVEEAFHALENAYASAGFPQPASGPVTRSLMTLTTLKLAVNPSLDVAFQLGGSADKENDIKLRGGMALARRTLPGDGHVSVFAGLGGGFSGFAFTRRYGAPISTVDASGGYYQLQTLTLKGGGPYWTIVGGVSLRTGVIGAIHGFVQQISATDVSSNQTIAGRLSVNMSGTLVGASFSCRF